MEPPISCSGFPFTHSFTQELLSVRVYVLEKEKKKKLPSERAELESHPISYNLHKYTSALRNSSDSRDSRINEMTLKLEHSDVVLSIVRLNPA